MNQRGGSNIVLPNNAYRNRWGQTSVRPGQQIVNSLFEALGGMAGHSARARAEVARAQVMGRVNAENEGMAEEAKVRGRAAGLKDLYDVHREEGLRRAPHMTPEAAQDWMAVVHGTSATAAPISLAPTRTAQQHYADPNKEASEGKSKKYQDILSHPAVAEAMKNAGLKHPDADNIPDTGERD